MSTNIMVAGKSQENVRLVKEAVANLDYQVIPAPAMSLALFLARKNLPELIVCDTEMTDGNAELFLQELRADDELKAIPFMVLPRSPLSDELSRNFMRAGAALVLSCSPNSWELLSTIEPYISARLNAKTERIVETSE